MYKLSAGPIESSVEEACTNRIGGIDDDGVKVVLLPEENLKDLDELPSNVRNDMTFKGMKVIDEVLAEALVK